MYMHINTSPIFVHYIVKGMGRLIYNVAPYEQVTPKSKSFYFFLHISVVKKHIARGVQLIETRSNVKRTIENGVHNFSHSIIRKHVMCVC